MRYTTITLPSKTLIPMYAEDNGLLIALEGLDGSGKTTQRKLLKSWLERMDADVVVTKWNSSPLFKPLIKEKKAARLLNPVEYALLHSADFWHRYETVIQPALCAGKTVIADRYVYTGLARDAARGINREWSHGLYAGARQPDIIFYFKASPNTCARRITATREIKFYEAGQDVSGIEHAVASYIRFSATVLEEYARVLQGSPFVVIDAELPIYEQHRSVREICLRRFGQDFVSGAGVPELNVASYTGSWS